MFPVAGNTGGFFMNHSVKITLQVLLVVFVVAVLCFALPTLALLEIFCVSVGMLIVAAGWLIVIREVNKLVDLKHRNSVQQKLRELELEKREREQQSLLVSRRTRVRGRYY